MPHATSAGVRWLDTIRGQPRGVCLVAFVEVWERTSFYGMLALLALFLVASPSVHGFGWANGDAVRLVGLYISMIYGASVLGGWLADRFFGARRALALGGLSMCMGHFLMAGPALVPLAIEHVSGVPVQDVLQGAGYPLARLGSIPDASAAIRAHLEALPAAAGPIDRAVSVSVFAYVAAGASFYLAIFFLVFGTGLFKPNSYVVIGSLYRDNDVRRDSGFILHYMGINTGALLGPLIVGTVGELVGWHYGFTIAGFGMAIGLAIYLRYQRTLLADCSWQRPSERRRASSNTPRFTRLENDRILIVVMLSLFAAIFWTAFYQMGGLMNLYALESVDRSLSGLEVPATWFQALNPLYVIIFGPLLVSLWRSLELKGRNPELCTKFSIGLALIGLCFLAMWLATFDQQASPIMKAGMAWLVLAYLLMTLGELCLSPVGNAAVTRLAPKPVVGVMTGVWFLSSAIAGWLSGEIGAGADRYGERYTFLFLGLLTLSFAVLPLLMSRWITPRTRESLARVTA